MTKDPARGSIFGRWKGVNSQAVLTGRADQLVERARALVGGSHFFVDFVAALISEDAERVMVAVTDELLEDEQDAAMALLARAQAEDLLGRRDDAIATLEGLIAERPDFTSALLTQAGFLVKRAVTEGSDSRYADLTRAKDLSLAARNERRRWRGNSAEAAALAAEIAFNLGDLDEVLRIGLAGPDGEATGGETDDPTLASVVALAAIAVGRSDIARRLASEIPSGPHKSLIHGWLLEADGDRDGARHRYHEAFDAAEQPVDRRRVQTALAMLGEWPLPDWDELSATDPIQADELAALSEASRGLAEDAIVRIRRHAHESRQSAILLAEMLQESGDIESAVGVLEAARSRFDDPSVLVRAAYLLYRVDVPGARAMAKRALSEVPEGSSERIAMHRLLIQCGADEGDWAEVEAQARALLAAGDSEPTTRWALIIALYNQGSLAEAWATLKRGAGLQPEDETQARLWIDLHQRFNASEETVVRILELVEIYKESEQLIAQALMAIYSMGDAVALSSDTVSRLHGTTFDFTDRFPDSSIFMLVSAGSVEELIEQMRVRLAPGSAEFRELVEKVWLGQLPYGFLASFTGRPYSEALARRAAGCLPAHDASSAEAELDAARSAIGAKIAMTASALNILWYIQQSWPEIRASFASIATPRSTLLDAVAGREALALRSTMSLGWDPSSDSPVISEISDDQAEELFRRAAWIARECSTLVIVDGLRWERLPEMDEERTGPWLAPLELAFQRELSLFSDDVAIRSLARSLGVNAFGTIALITALVEAGRFTQAQADGFLIELAQGFVVDLRLPESDLFIVAQRESWGLGAASFTLARPAFWRRPVEALGTAIAMHREASKNQPDAAPGWLFAASSGVARAITPDVAAEAVGELLAAATTSAGLGAPTAFRANVEAARAGLTSVHDGDPLPRALTVLCQSLTKALDSAAASRALMGLVSSLEGPDRYLALRIVLDGCRGEAR